MAADVKANKTNGNLVPKKTASLALFGTSRVEANGPAPPTQLKDYMASAVQISDQLSKLAEGLRYFITSNHAELDLVVAQFAATRKQKYAEYEAKIEMKEDPYANGGWLGSDDDSEDGLAEATEVARAKTRLRIAERDLDLQKLRRREEKAITKIKKSFSEEVSRVFGQLQATGSAHDGYSSYNAVETSVATVKSDTNIPQSVYESQILDLQSKIDVANARVDNETAWVNNLTARNKDVESTLSTESARTNSEISRANNATARADTLAATNQELESRLIAEISRADKATARADGSMARSKELEDLDAVRSREFQIYLCFAVSVCKGWHEGGKQGYSDGVLVHARGRKEWVKTNQRNSRVHDADIELHQEVFKHIGYWSHKDKGEFGYRYRRQPDETLYSQKEKEIVNARVNMVNFFPKTSFSYCEYADEDRFISLFAEMEKIKATYFDNTTHLGLSNQARGEMMDEDPNIQQICVQVTSIRNRTKTNYLSRPR